MRRAERTGNPNPTPSDECLPCRWHVEGANRWARLDELCPKVSRPWEPGACDSIRKKWRETLHAAGVYERFEPMHLGYIEARGVPTQAGRQYVRVRGYVERLDENLRRGEGLLLKGPVGNMKTALAVAVLQEVLARGRTGLKVTLVSLMNTLFVLKARDRERWAEYEGLLRTADLLVLDDLGVEDTEGWVRTQVDSIITERHERRRALIATTNLSQAELKGSYAERLLDRLEHTCEVVNFAGPSLRQKGD